MKISMTDRAVASAGPGDLFDTQVKGLNLRTTAALVHTWYLLYTVPNGTKKARHKLGGYPQVSLAQARALALEDKALIASGTDPRGAKKAPTPGAMTVADLVKTYLERHVRPKLRSARSVERRLLKNVVPVIGGVRLADLHKREIIRCTDPILERGAPREATLVHKDLRSMLKWAVKRGELNSCATDGMDKPAEDVVCERVLTDPEITAIWNSSALKQHRHNVIKLCLLTAQRVGEVSGMRADEIDLNTRVWTIPADRSKNKHKHTVPLSDAACGIIKSAMPANSGQRLFPDTSTNSMGKHIARTDFGIAPWTSHDLRRTAITRMAELGVSPITLGHVINHRSTTKAGVTLSVYSHYDYAKEKREALSLWADRLAGIVGGGAATVTQIRRA